MRRRVLIILAALLIPLAGCLPAAAPPAFAPGDWQAFDQYAADLIGREMARYNLVGVSAAVVDGERIVWTKGFGYADAAGGVPATPDTVYSTGSVAKLLNAVAVLRLCDRGAIALDRPVSDYLADFSVRTRWPALPPVTLRHLLTHHSGLPGDLVDDMWGEDPPYFTAIVARLRDEYAAYPPGYMYAYSNVGSCLAGAVVERVAGESYAAFMEREVLRPLGMGRSAFARRPQTVAGLAKGYDREGREQKEVAIRDMPAGGLYASAVDLGRFLAMLFTDGRSGGRQILSPASAAEMLRAQPSTPLDGTFRIGLEFFLDYPEFAYAGRVAGHGGETYLFRSHVLAAVDHKVGVVVLTNSAGARSRAVAVELLKAAVAVKTGLVPPAAAPQPAYSLPGVPAGDPAGYYGTAAGLASVTAGDRPELAVLGRRVRLTPGADGWYEPELLLGGVVPVPVSLFKDLSVAFRTVDGDDVVFLRDGAKVSAVGRRAAPAPIPARWLRHIGDYELLGAENSQLKLDRFRIALQEDFLVAELASAGESGRFLLRPVADGEAVLYGLGRRMMETMTAAGGPGEERLLFAGLVFRKLQPEEYESF